MGKGGPKHLSDPRPGPRGDRRGPRPARRHQRFLRGLRALQAGRPPARHLTAPPRPHRAGRPEDVERAGARLRGVHPPALLGMPRVGAVARRARRPADHGRRPEAARLRAQIRDSGRPSNASHGASHGGLAKLAILGPKVPRGEAPQQLSVPGTPLWDSQNSQNLRSRIDRNGRARFAELPAKSPDRALGCHRLQNRRFQVRVLAAPLPSARQAPQGPQNGPPLQGLCIA
jgi:hypothetical protein